MFINSKTILQSLVTLFCFAGCLFSQGQRSFYDTLHPSGQNTSTAAATRPADNVAASLRGEASAAAPLQASHVEGMHRALQRLQARFPAARATMQLGGEVWEAPPGGGPPARLQPPAPWHRLPHVDSMAAALLPKHGAPLPVGPTQGTAVREGSFLRAHLGLGSKHDAFSYCAR